jgi:hypothetical protein
VGVDHRRAHWVQRACRGRSSAMRISIRTCGLRGLSPCLRGLRGHEADQRVTSAVTRGAIAGPIHPLAPSAPLDRRSPLRTPCARGPQGWKGQAAMVNHWRSAADGDHEPVGLRGRMGPTPPCCRALRSAKPRRAPEARNELPPAHSITSSASASTCGGMERPSALAVLRLMTNSNLLD